MKIGKKGESEFIAIITMIIIFVIFGFGFLMGADWGIKKGYKDGQVDVIVGNIKYELVINKDKSMTWAEKNESSTNTR